MCFVQNKLKIAHEQSFVTDLPFDAFKNWVLTIYLKALFIYKTD